MISPKLHQVCTVFASRRFLAAWHELPPAIQENVRAKIHLLVTNPTHPSLRSHRMRSQSDLWNCSLSSSMRLFYQSKSKPQALYLFAFGSHRMVDRVRGREKQKYEVESAEIPKQTDCQG
jgi:mRNA-degrading endonuclease YafQ of YafQ-DinJ toxin-antitoxin module